MQSGLLQDFSYPQLRDRKSVAMTTLVARYCQKANHLQIFVGFWNAKNPQKYLQVQETKKLLPWHHMLPGVALKLIISYPRRELECKEPTKIFISTRNRKKCCHGYKSQKLNSI